VGVGFRRRSAGSAKGSSSLSLLSSLSSLGCVTADGRCASEERDELVVLCALEAEDGNAVAVGTPERDDDDGGRVVARLLLLLLLFERLMAGAAGSTDEQSNNEVVSCATFPHRCTAPLTRESSRARGDSNTQ
jgi:hypothetical protein